MAEQKVLTNIINGEAVAAQSGETLDLVNPATGEVFATSPKSGAADIDAAYAAAAEAFQSWRWTTPSERQEALLKLADFVEDHADELVQIESENTGKPQNLTASEELPPSVNQIRFFAGAARILEGRSQGEYMRGFTSSIRREPVGVIGQVTPWNYPLMMFVWKFGPALAAGNTIVVKPSDTTPASTVWLGQAMQEFFPPGVVNVVCGDRETGAQLTAHKTPAMLSITGSTRAGMAVAQAAAADLKRAHLELGGNAPVVVFDDADIDAAVEGISVAGLFNAGQDCTAGTRVLCQAGVYDQFVKALGEAAAATKTGYDPTDEDILFGPLNNPNQLARVTGLMGTVPSHARVVTGGHAVAGDGFFFEPTVVADLLQDDDLVRQEIFGPVITVQKFADEDEAVRLANDTEYGLSASVWTANASTATRMTIRLDFGCVWVNTHIPLIGDMPHGGFKHSGYGKDMSIYAVEDYTRIKHVMQYHGFEG